MRTEHLVSDGPHPIGMGGVQRIYKFPNGYGASVIRISFSYGGLDGLWEVAILDQYDNLCYTTPITSDVIGHLTEDGVDEILQNIADLPKGGDDNG